MKYKSLIIPLRLATLIGLILAAAYILLEHTLAQSRAPTLPQSSESPFSEYIKSIPGSTVLAEVAVQQTTHPNAEDWATGVQFGDYLIQLAVNNGLASPLAISIKNEGNLPIETQLTEALISGAHVHIEEKRRDPEKIPTAILQARDAFNERMEKLRETYGEQWLHELEREAFSQPSSNPPLHTTLLP